MAQPFHNASSLTVAPRPGLGQAVDIEISVVSARGVTNPHKLKQKSSFCLELLIDKDTETTNTVQSEGKVVLWNTSRMLKTTISSNLIIRMYCKHRHTTNDHIVGEASFKALKLERNKDIEVELYDPTRSDRKKTVSTYVKLRLTVALSVTFNVGSDAEMDLRSSSYLKQMERIVGSISSDKFKQLSPAWIRLFSSLTTFSAIAQKVAELDSLAKGAVGAVASAIKVLVDQIERDERIEGLGRTMCDLYDYVLDACSVQKIASFEKALKQLLAQTTECAYFIGDYRSISIFAQRALVNIVSNTDSMISSFESAFGDLKIALILGSSLQTTLVSYRILQNVERIENLIRIDGLPILRNVGWASDKICLRGTREITIERIVHWASQYSRVSSTDHIYLLSGPTTCGKSTITHTIAKVFHEQRRLGAAVFIHSNVPEPNSCKISSTIIHQLAGYHSTFQAHIATTIKDDPSLLDADIDRQFRKLIVDTTSSIGNHLSMIGPIIIVIDNLHFLDDGERSKVLITIAKYSGNLASNFRFILTCRDDDAVTQRTLGNLSRMHVIGYDDTDGGSSVSISQYILESLKDLFSKEPRLSERYSVQELQDQLVERSRGIHFWVTTVYRSVLACEDDDVFHFFAFLLSRTVPLSNDEAMDHLYHTIFKIFFLTELGTRKFFQLSAWKLLNVMIQSPRPMLLSHLRRITYIPYESSKQGLLAVDTARNLGLIIDVKRDELAASLFALHPSFLDFLTNPLQKGRGSYGYTDLQILLDQSVAEVCIHIMSQSLRHNICRLDDIMTTNMEIVDKDARIEEYLPRPLRYACCNWTLHLEGGLELEDTLRHKLQSFTSSHLLHWIEAMSILGHFDEIEPGLLRFLRWLQAQRVRASDVLYVLAADTIQFVRSFSSIIRKAPLQTFISALPLMPPVPGSSLLEQCNADIVSGRFISTPRIKSLWNVETQSVSNAISCCVYGALVVLGSRNGGVSFFDARTKTGVDYNIKIDDKIFSMAFSPDGQNLATKTNSGQVYVYNVKTGTRILHTRNANTSRANISWPKITYSNCNTILTDDYFFLIGNRDYYLSHALIRFLRHSGMPVAPESLQGAALSPDGQQLAVPSKFGVQLVNMDNGAFKDIDMRSGEQDRNDLDHCVIAWSPDGSLLSTVWLVDDTVRLWSFQDGMRWTSEIGHIHTFWSPTLTFCSDSSLLVFTHSYKNNANKGSFKIRIWNTETGLLIGEEEFDDEILHALSIPPDGQEIILLSKKKMYSLESPDGWNILIHLLSNTTPAYMTNPPTFHDFKSVPTVTHSFSRWEPSREYGTTVDVDGWVVNSEEERFLLAPYPNYHISTSHLSSISTCLEIRHPESQKVVLKYIFKWGARIG
ncbi:hypothetical protein CVT25_008150 [Psilocybe cyanescens]|uniref:Nephrocystin 3-like N-terminal domain-containing protein n=1 Tax=Psilocybe cyanescens TaxID=93625 RepID=A0A409XST7_PSICY|nr:hypothetical protein CVT25_008150 [Psilocybe cyanescens]